MDRAIELLQTVGLFIGGVIVVVVLFMLLVSWLDRHPPKDD